MYQALAQASEGSLRAWYLAAATTGPDEAVARALVAAAEDARRRGGYSASARAWRRAADLSAATLSRVARLMHAADDAFLAGDSRSAVTWCEEALRDCRDPLDRGIGRDRVVAADRFEMRFRHLGQETSAGAGPDG